MDRVANLNDKLITLKEITDLKARVGLHPVRHTQLSNFI